MDEVGSGSHGVEVAVFRGFFHAVPVEFEGGGEAGEQADHLRGAAHGEGWLLRLLHVLIVRQGQTFELEGDGCGCAVDAADFGSDEFGEVGVFLLRHCAGAGGECFGELDEVELGGGKEGDFFGEAAGVEADEGEGLQVFEDEVAVAGCVHAVGGGRGEVELFGGDGAVEGERCSGDCA
jgi:hypothetical protein